MDFFLSNKALAASFAGAFVAQLLKPFLLWPVERKFRYPLFFTTGGMPSSHTSMVVALCTSIFLTEGPKSLAFAISLTFSLIIMHDAMGIRQAAGKQAKVINELSQLLAKIHAEGEFTPENLKTMLGHSFVQVVGGIAVGLATGLIVTLKL
ncbi:MAG: divergent PAP2 family protein [Sphaerochaetaceae bacterium]